MANGAQKELKEQGESRDFFCVASDAFRIFARRSSMVLGSAWAFAKAVHLKLDELIRALKGARNELVDLEKLSDEALTSLETQFERVRKKAERNGNNPGDGGGRA